MNLTLDMNMLYTIIVALFAYDLIRLLIGLLTGHFFKPSEKKTANTYGSGSGPGGMVVGLASSLPKNVSTPEKPGQ